MSDSEKEIERVVESYKAAVLAADAEAFMRLYHPAVRVFDTWGVWLYDGAAAWQRAVEGWFASLGSERVRVSFSDVQIIAGRPLAVLDAIVTYTAESAKGEALRSMQNRITWVLRETGHVLRIVHEHSSAPVGFEDSKAILTRAPAT
ncbi:MAG TPA: nuclear transport factor 2 family protein [Caldimonas sp.]|nr:nuclear transport factor 2 family protein [Caldimonas sp.]